jgi:hypothetical protein
MFAAILESDVVSLETYAVAFRKTRWLPERLVCIPDSGIIHFDLLRLIFSEGSFGFPVGVSKKHDLFSPLALLFSLNR